MKIIPLASLLAIMSLTFGEAQAKDPQPLPEPVEKPNWSLVRKQSEEALRARLIDPASATLTWKGGFQWVYYNRLHRDWGWVGCGTINAKNRMGGYVGQRGFAVVYNNGVKFVDMESGDRWQGLQEMCRDFPPPQLELTVAGEAKEKPGSSIADELAKLSKLKSDGSISETEFQTLKQRLISGD